MVEQKIMEVLRKAQDILDEKQLGELKEILQISFADCDLVKNTELMVIDDSWMDDLEDFIIAKMLEGRSRETTIRYQYELHRLLSYINKPVDMITDGDISRYMRTYKATRKVANVTLRNVRAVFNSFFTWLRDRDRIRKNPMVLVSDIKVEQILKKPYTDEERELLSRNCTNLRDKAMLEFLYSTAVRVSEFLSLDRKDLNFMTRDLLVYGKGGKERIVYLNDRSCMYMKDYLDSRDDDNPALFVGLRKPNKRLTKAGAEDIIRRIGKRAGVEDAHPHRFRRTAATNALNRGMPLQEVSRFLGHAKLETTMIYCTVDQASVQYHHKKYLSA